MLVQPFTNGDYLKFEADIDKFLLAIVLTGDTNASNNREWELANSGAQIDALNSDIQTNYKGIKLANQSKDYAFPITKIAKVYNQPNDAEAVNTTITSVSLVDDGGGATLTDGDYDSNNTYTIKIHLNQTDDTKTTIYSTMNLGTLTFNKQDNLLAADYITVTKSIGNYGDAGVGVPSIPSPQNDPNAADLLSNNAGNITFSNMASQISVSVAALSLTDGGGNGTALSSAIHQLIDSDATVVNQNQPIDEVRHLLRNHMTGTGWAPHNFRGIVSTNTSSLTVPVDMKTKFNGSSFVASGYTEESRVNDFTWTPKFIVNWSTASQQDWNIEMYADAADSIVPGKVDGNQWVTYDSNNGTATTQIWLVKTGKFITNMAGTTYLGANFAQMIGYINVSGRGASRSPFPSKQGVYPTLMEFRNSNVPNGYYGVKFGAALAPTALE